MAALQLTKLIFHTPPDQAL